jgi:hypothetical protein
VRLFCGCAHVSCLSLLIWPKQPRGRTAPRRSSQDTRAPRFFLPALHRATRKKHQSSILCIPFLCSIFSSYMLAPWMFLWYDREGMETRQNVLEAGLIPRGRFFACVLQKRLCDGEVSTRRSGGPSVARCIAVCLRQVNVLAVHGPDCPHPGRKKHPSSMPRRRRRDLSRPPCDLLIPAHHCHAVALNDRTGNTCHHRPRVE